MVGASGCRWPLLTVRCLTVKLLPGGGTRVPLFSAVRGIQALAIDKWCTLYYIPLSVRIIFTYEQYAAYEEYFPEKQMIVASMLSDFPPYPFSEKSGQIISP